MSLKMENKETNSCSQVYQTFSKRNETNFTDLNKVLEEKVNDLMSEVDMILTKQIDLIRVPKQRAIKKREDLSSKNTINSTLGLEPKQSDCALTSIRSTTKVINEDNSNEKIEWIGNKASVIKSVHTTATKLPSESVILFFKDQIVKLQTDLHTIQHEKKKMEGQCKQLEAQIRKQLENEEKMLNQQNYYKDSILKIETANTDMCLKVQAQNAQIILLKKEIENLNKKITCLNQLSTNNELRLNRNIEENDKLRSSLKISQTGEKESREFIRKIQEEKRLTLRTSEKQRTEIFQALKKQMQLVDNLKKQKLYLETNKQIQFLEKEFTKVLEWKVI